VLARAVRPVGGVEAGAGYCAGDVAGETSPPAWRCRATGIREEISIAQVVTLADGKMTRIESYHRREEALEAVGLRG
jgi:hypothetical protein